MDYVNDISVGEVFASFFLSEVPKEGWKIHISCTLKNYTDIIKDVLKIVFEEKCSFKIVKDIEIYKKNLLKNGDRYSSGKLITLYPKDNEQFKRILDLLYSALSKYDGSYIITDRRYKDAKCLYYRYGSNFLSGLFDSKGRSLRVIHDGFGNIILDEGKPYYDVPQGIICPIMDSSDPSTSSILLNKYDISRALRFSPMGGIYEGKRKEDGKSVIIKESFPNTGMVDENTDAIRLRMQERENLIRLSGFNFIPEVSEDFFDWENYYLVLEKIKGHTLVDWVSINIPILLYKDSKEVKSYVEDSIKIILDVAEKIKMLKDAGYIMTDLSPDNILVSENEVYLLDFEVLSSENSDNKIFSYSPGFGKEGNNAYENLIYGLSSLLLYVFSKENDLFDSVEPYKLLKPILIRYPELKEITDSIMTIRACSTIEEVIEELRSLSVLADLAKYDKFDTIMPLFSLKNNDIVEKCNKMLITTLDPYMDKNSISTGAGGIFLAKKYLGLEISEDERDSYFNNYEMRSGSLFHGVSGEVILRLLYNQDYRELLEYLNKYFVNSNDFSLETGLSGYGIALCEVYRSDRDEKILKKIENIVDRLPNNDDIRSFGLSQGKAGVALFLIEAYSVLNSLDVLKKAESLVYKCVRKLELEYSSLFKMITSIDISSPYLYEGTFGILSVILCLIKKNREKSYSKYEDFLKDFLKKYVGCYSQSTSFINGTAGILYVYLESYNYFKEKFLIDGIEFLTSDLVSRYDNGGFFHSNVRKSYFYDYFHGDVGTLCVLNMLKEKKLTNLFPFVGGDYA